MTKLTNCKSCGEEISKKEKNCPKCAEPTNYNLIDNQENYPTFEDGSIDYYNIKDPRTEVRYNIPFLSTEDNEYVSKYIHFMKTKIENPEQFNDIMAWR